MLTTWDKKHSWFLIFNSDYNFDNIYLYFLSLIPYDASIITVNLVLFLWTSCSKFINWQFIHMIRNEKKIFKNKSFLVKKTYLEGERRNYTEKISYLVREKRGIITLYHIKSKIMQNHIFSLSLSIYTLKITCMELLL